MTKTRPSNPIEKLIFKMKNTVLSYKRLCTFYASRSMRKPSPVALDYMKQNLNGRQFVYGHSSYCTANGWKKERGVGLHIFAHEHFRFIYVRQRMSSYVSKKKTNKSWICQNDENDKNVEFRLSSNLAKGVRETYLVSFFFLFMLHWINKSKSIFFSWLKVCVYHSRRLFPTDVAFSNRHRLLFQLPVAYLSNWKREFPGIKPIKIPFSFQNTVLFYYYYSDT